MVRTFTWLLTFVGVSLIAANILPAGQAPYTPLFDGKTLKGWAVENSDGTNFTVANGALSVSGPQGWLRSLEQYSNFSLRVAVRFLTDDADSGIFFRVPAPATDVWFRGWPANSYQLQMRDMSRNKTATPLWAGNLYRHRVPAQGDTTFNRDAAHVAIRGTGEWQVFEIDVFDDRVVARINAVEVLRAGGIVNRNGFIGIQGEAGKTEIRRIELQQR